MGVGGKNGGANSLNTTGGAQKSVVMPKYGLVLGEVAGGARG